MLDQTFPRSTAELEMLSAALGLLDEGLISGEWLLVMPAVFGVYLDSFDWDQCQSYPLLRDVYTLLSLWFSRGSATVKKIDCSLAIYPPEHPVPLGTEPSVGVELWSEEMGRLLVLHNGLATPKPFIAIASEGAFGGGELDVYPPGLPADSHFPLTGPSTLSSLEDSLDWEVDEDTVKREVSCDCLRSNLALFGAVIEKPSGGGSHWKVTFPRGSRPYMLDYNVDPQPDRFLKELVPLVHLPLQVIKQTLLHGKLPRKSFRLKKHQV